MSQPILHTLELNVRAIQTKTSAGNGNAGNFPKALVRIVQMRRITLPTFASRTIARKWDCQMDGSGARFTPKDVTTSTCASDMPPTFPLFLLSLGLMPLIVLLPLNNVCEVKLRK